MDRTRLLNMLQREVAFDGKLYGLTQRSVNQLVMNLGLQPIPFHATSTIKTGYNYETAIRKDQNGAIFFKWHAPDAAAPFGSFSRTMWTVQVRFTVNKYGIVQFHYVDIDPSNGNLSWSLNNRTKTTHIPLISAPRKPSKKLPKNSSTDSTNCPSAYNKASPDALLGQLELEVTKMVRSFNQLYLEGFEYFDGESSKRYTEREKKRVLHSIKKICEKPTLSKLDILKLEQRYTILCIYEDNHNQEIEDFRKKIDFFDNFDKKFFK